MGRDEDTRSMRVGELDGVEGGDLLFFLMFGSMVLVKQFSIYCYCIFLQFKMQIFFIYSKCSF